MINTPGHMDAILYAANQALGVECSYKGSNHSIDIFNEHAVNFTKAILMKYIKYFSRKGSKYFNLGCDEFGDDVILDNGYGYGDLVRNGTFGYFIKYLNEIVQLVKKEGMTPITFNDGIFYNNITSQEIDGKLYSFDKDILISYWFIGGPDNLLAKPDMLLEAGYKIINTNKDWYYVLGKDLNISLLKETRYDELNGHGAAKVQGCMVCFWCDIPSIKFNQKVINDVYLQIKICSISNPEYFNLNLI